VAELSYKFSETFGITRTGEDDWLDTVLPVDTTLFVDPFLIYGDSSEFWSDAHDRLIDFFNYALEYIEKARKPKRYDRSSAHYEAARRLFLFPEPAEFCLGYGDTPFGAGASYGLRTAMLDAAETSVELGIKSVRHFEELTLFRDQIGADRVSDIVCNVLKSHFIDYTHSVMERHELFERAEEIVVAHASWSRAAGGWLNRREAMLLNPFTTRNIGILLVPERFLRSLPMVDPYEFWDWAFANENENIRGQFNYDIGMGVKKSREIARLASANPRLVRKYVRRFEKDPKPSYDIERDPGGELSWYEAAKILLAKLVPPDGPLDEKKFCEFIEMLIDKVTDAIENRQFSELLWLPDGRPRDEKSVQRLISATLLGYCEENDIDLTPESNAGSGPVDFKLSQGWKKRAIIEVKLANNGKYWSGLKKQTIQYMKAENVKCGYFLTVQFTEEDFSDERRKRVTESAEAVTKATGRKVTPKFLDATQKPSASKL